MNEEMTKVTVMELGLAIRKMKEALLRLDTLLLMECQCGKCEEMSKTLCFMRNQHFNYLMREEPIKVECACLNFLITECSCVDKLFGMCLMIKYRGDLLKSKLA